MGKYRAYKSYKDSGVEWLRDIPEHWEAIRIKFSTYIKGRVGWHGLNSKEFLYEGNYYLVTGTDFKSRNIGHKLRKLEKSQENLRIVRNSERMSS